MNTKKNRKNKIIFLGIVFVLLLIVLIIGNSRGFFTSLIDPNPPNTDEEQTCRITFEPTYRRHLTDDEVSQMKLNVSYKEEHSWSSSYIVKEGELGTYNIPKGIYYAQLTNIPDSLDYSGSNQKEYTDN